MVHIVSFYLLPGVHSLGGGLHIPKQKLFVSCHRREDTEMNETVTSGNIQSSAQQSHGGDHIFFGPIPKEPTQEAVEGIRFDFNDGARVKFPKGAKSYRIRFVDLDNMVTLYDGIVPPGGDAFAISEKKFFVNFRIVLSKPEDDELVFAHDYDARGKVVMVRFAVHTLGDSIGWFSYVERFQKKTGCKLVCVVSPWFSELVRKQYPDITFIPVEDVEQYQPYANYNIGLYGLGNSDNQPLDHRYVGLHRTAAHILGVDDSDSPPRFNLSAKRKIKEKYVCIAVQSTSLAKFWNHPTGWDTVVQFLKEQGYRVLCVDRSPIGGKCGTFIRMPAGAEDFTGNRPLQERIDLIKDADFFIGLSSGLSWLAWGCRVPVVMISGFTLPINEFNTPYRVFNKNVCNGCWNEFKDFDLSDFWYCPRHGNTDRRFECTGLISPDKVIDTIKRLIRDREHETRTQP